MRRKAKDEEAEAAGEGLFEGVARECCRCDSLRGQRRQRWRGDSALYRGMWLTPPSWRGGGGGSERRG